MNTQAYWSVSASEVLERLATTTAGLLTAEADRRLARYGPNELHERQRVTRTLILFNQIRSPLLLLLVFAAAASALAGAWPDA